MNRLDSFLDEWWGWLWVAVAAIVVATVLIVGCGDDYSTGPSESPGFTRKIVVDGTTCIIYRDVVDADIGVGGISCDWGPQ